MTIARDKINEDAKARRNRYRDGHMSSGYDKSTTAHNSGSSAMMLPEMGGTVDAELRIQYDSVDCH